MGPTRVTLRWVPAAAVLAGVLTACAFAVPAARPAWPTPQDAAAATGHDPADVLVFTGNAAIVEHGPGDMVSLTAWRRADDGWVAAGGYGESRHGELADAVVMGGPPSTSWQVDLIFGFLPRGVASIDPDIPGSVMAITESGAYVLVLGDVNDPRTADMASLAWRMRDANGRVVRSGRGDCCIPADGT